MERDINDAGDTKIDSESNPKFIALHYRLAPDGIEAERATEETNWPTTHVFPAVIIS